MNEWTLCLDERKAIDILYLDFQKAFDKVPNIAIRLISKLQAWHRWKFIYVTRHEKTGLMYTKYTSSYYGTYLLYCLGY